MCVCVCVCVHACMCVNYSTKSTYSLEERSHSGHWCLWDGLPVLRPGHWSGISSEAGAAGSYEC